MPVTRTLLQIILDVGAYVDQLATPVPSLDVRGLPSSLNVLHDAVAGLLPGDERGLAEDLLSMCECRLARKQPTLLPPAVAFPRNGSLHVLAHRRDLRSGSATPGLYEADFAARELRFRCHVYIRDGKSYRRLTTLGAPQDPLTSRHLVYVSRLHYAVVRTEVDLHEKAVNRSLEEPVAHGELNPFEALLRTGSPGARRMGASDLRAHVAREMPEETLLHRLRDAFFTGDLFGLGHEVRALCREPFAALPEVLRTRSGRSVSRIGFGTDGVSDPTVLLSALDEGYRLFDTAASYSNSPVIATALDRSPVPREDMFLVYKIKPAPGLDARMEVLKGLRELRTSYIDVIMLHEMAEDDALTQSMLRNFQNLIDEGVVRYVGLSNADLFDLARWTEPARDMPRIVMIQNKFNPFWPDLDVRRECAAKGIHYMGYSILGGNTAVGVCGKANSSLFPHYDVLSNPVLKRLAGTGSVAQLAVAWALHEGTMQIPKSRERARMKENLLAGQLQLNASTINQIRGLDDVVHDGSEELGGAAKLQMLQRESPSRQRRRRLAALYADGGIKRFLDALADSAFDRFSLRLSHLLRYLEESELPSLAERKGIQLFQQACSMATGPEDIEELLKWVHGAESSCHAAMVNELSQFVGVKASASVAVVSPEDVARIVYQMIADADLTINTRKELEDYLKNEKAGIEVAARETFPGFTLTPTLTSAIFNFLATYLWGAS